MGTLEQDNLPCLNVGQWKLQKTRFLENTVKLITGKSAKVFYGKERSGKVHKRHKVLSSEEYITQHNTFVFDFRIRKVKDTNRNFVLSRKVQKPYEDNIRSDFSFSTWWLRERMMLMCLRKLLENFGRGFAKICGRG